MHMLTLDPRVKEFSAQPFTIDLIDRRILRTPDELKDARTKHRKRIGPKFYTPDFSFELHGPLLGVLEVKLEGYEGDDVYQAKLAQAREVIEANGHIFPTVIFPKDPKHPLRGNLLLLNKAALREDLRPSPELVLAIESACGNDSITLGTLCSTLGISPNLTPSLFVFGVLGGDLMHHAINNSLPVNLAFGDLSHLQFLSEVGD